MVGSSFLGDTSMEKELTKIGTAAPSVTYRLKARVVETGHKTYKEFAERVHPSHNLIPNPQRTRVADAGHAAEDGARIRAELAGVQGASLALSMSRQKSAAPHEERKRCGHLPRRRHWSPSQYGSRRQDPVGCAGRMGATASRGAPGHPTQTIESYRIRRTAVPSARLNMRRRTPVGTVAIVTKKAGVRSWTTDRDGD